MNQESRDELYQELSEILVNVLFKKLLQEALKATAGSEDLWLERGQGSGAAVLTKSGQVYSASHKNRASGGGTHAEILALNIALENNINDPVVAVALVSANPKARNRFWYPCGHCRQEYIDNLLYLKRKGFVEQNHDIEFICGKPGLTYKRHKLSELLPYSWNPADED